MAYTGSDPNLIDLQNQITTNLNAANAALLGLKTQIKQVTLALEAELTKLQTSFNALQSFVNSNIPS